MFEVHVVIKCGFKYITYYRQNLLKRSFCHIVFMWERDISHQYPSVKRKVTESARYVTHTQLEKLTTTPKALVAEVLENGLSSLPGVQRVNFLC